MWHYDFTRGASSVGLTLPDRTLLTRPERFRLRVRGEAKGHPVTCRVSRTITVTPTQTEAPM